MRIWALLIVVASLEAWIAGAVPLQITENPLPAPVETQGLMVEICDLVRLPENTRNASSGARCESGWMGARELCPRPRRRPSLHQ